jgi:hypothetical protein
MRFLTEAQQDVARSELGLGAGAGPVVTRGGVTAASLHAGLNSIRAIQSDVSRLVQNQQEQRLRITDVEVWVIYLFGCWSILTWSRRLSATRMALVISLVRLMFIL